MTHELPLFPLNTVLFPSIPLHLHIFEKRYLQMIGECIRNKEPFGVVLIKSGMEASGPLAEPYRVGCTAQIAQVEKLPQGRLNIAVVGRDRFRIESLDAKGHPYLSGSVGAFPLEEGYPGELEEAKKEIRPWLERYLRLVTASEVSQAEMPDLPAEPQAMFYLAAALLQIPPVEKQALLEAPRWADFAAKLAAVLRREVSLLQSIQSKDAGPGKEPFSRN